MSFRSWATLSVLGLVFGSFQLLPEATPAAFGAGPDNVVLQWNAAALQGVRDAKLGPPMVSRALAIVHTCIYDAWAAYDSRAFGTRLGGTLRRPSAERTAANKAKAMSFAAYRAAADLFPGDVGLFNSVMSGLGYDPSDSTTDRAAPSGIGNVACAAVLAFRHHDGSNQQGDLAPGAYGDYTGYTPHNDPMVVASFQPSTVHDPSRWEPLTYADAAGHLGTPLFVGPQWNRVQPFALRSDSQFRSPTGPARYPSARFTDQARELLDISANLTDTQKAVAEYWADGPRSELPPGHWDLFAQFVSRRDHHDQDADAKMFFALTNAVFDAGIVAWDNKIAFDSVRPITAIRYLFAGKQVLAWAGPGQGTKLIDGKDWMPYQQATFPTPPFPEYSSGHSNFSAAGAEILRLFTGSDTFGASATIRAGSSKVEPGITPATDVVLSWPTFSAAADEAGMSRRYGGIHFAQGDLDGRLTGRRVADQAWTKAVSLFYGMDLTHPR
jgi:hypothetical protein